VMIAGRRAVKPRLQPAPHRPHAPRPAAATRAWCSA
jgi:hypothetical protein